MQLPGIDSETTTVVHCGDSPLSHQSHYYFPHSSLHILQFTSIDKATRKKINKNHRNHDAHFNNDRESFRTHMDDDDDDDDDGECSSHHVSCVHGSTIPVDQHVSRIWICHDLCRYGPIDHCVCRYCIQIATRFNPIKVYGIEWMWVTYP